MLYRLDVDLELYSGRKLRELVTEAHVKCLRLSCPSHSQGVSLQHAVFGSRMRVENMESKWRSWQMHAKDNH